LWFHDDIIDSTENILLCCTSRLFFVVGCKLISWYCNWRRRIIPHSFYILTKLFVLLLSFNNHQISLYLFLELISDARLIDCIAIRFSLKIIERYIVFLFVYSFQFFSYLLLVWIKLLVDLSVAILFHLLWERGRNFGKAPIVVYSSRCEPIGFKVLDVRQHEMLTLVVWLF